MLTDFTRGTIFYEKWNTTRIYRTYCLGYSVNILVGIQYNLSVNQLAFHGRQMIGRGRIVFAAPSCRNFARVARTENDDCFLQHSRRTDNNTKKNSEQRNKCSEADAEEEFERVALECWWVESLPSIV